MRKYLLSIEDLMGPAAEGLWEQAFYGVDSERRQKAERLGAKRPRAACLGAGLLLQLALREALEADGCGQGPAAYPGDFREAGGAFCGGPEGFTVCGLLERLGGRPPLPLTFRYGGRGKPYLREYPFFFNLSHSGSFCICALSGEEVGADIQQHRPGAGMRIAKRSFSGCGPGRKPMESLRERGLPVRREWICCRRRHWGPGFRKAACPEEKGYYGRNIVFPDTVFLFAVIHRKQAWNSYGPRGHETRGNPPGR